MSNKLLLADDSITIRKVVGIIFANEDYSLAVVDNGNAALEKAREIKPDIIMADVVMPEKTGYEVCAEIRRDPALKHIPLLLMTGAFEPFDEERARQCGADDFISKPFESQQLIDKVKSLIALGKERLVAPAEPVPAAAVAPEPVPAIAAAPPPEAPLVGAMGGVFLQAEETAPEPPASPLPTEELTFTTEELTLPAEELTLPAEELTLPAEELTLPAEELSLQTEEISLPAEELSFSTEQPAATEEAAEALPEDDLWDVFTLEDEAEGETAEAETLLESEIVAPLDTEEEFSFTTDEEMAPFDAGAETPGTAVTLGADAFEMEADAFELEVEPAIGEGLALDDQLKDEAFDTAPEAAEEISFVSGLDEVPPAAGTSEVEFDFDLEEEPAPTPPPVDLTSAGGTFEFADEAGTQAAFVSAPEEPAPAVAPAAPEIDLQFAPEEEYVPVPPPVEPPVPPVQQAEPVAPPVALVAPAVPQPAPAGQPAPGAAMSEEQLAAAIAGISREVIERIVWEVVPDLAETLIREEIRKLKEGLRR